MRESRARSKLARHKVGLNQAFLKFAHVIDRGQHEPKLEAARTASFNVPTQGNPDGDRKLACSLHHQPTAFSSRLPAARAEPTGSERIRYDGRRALD